MQIQQDYLPKVAAHQICDGKQDCPAGNDELFDCENLTIVPAVHKLIYQSLCCRHRTIVVSNVPLISELLLTGAFHYYNLFHS